MATSCSQLKMKASDGKMRETDAADIQENMNSNPLIPVVIGAVISLLTTLFTNYGLRNNLNKEHEFIKKLENTQFLRQRKEEIFKILKKDYDRLVLVLNSYRMFGPEKGIDEIDGYFNSSYLFKSLFSKNH